MTEAEKKKAIQEAYETMEGLGSMQKTYQKAKAKVDSVTQKDVKDLSLIHISEPTRR